MDKKIFLILILLSGVLLRVWNLDLASVRFGGSFDFVLSSNLFAALFDNAYAPVYFLYLKLLSLPYINVLLPYSSVICSVLGVLVMYFAGFEYAPKNNKENTALTTAGFCAISMFLIYFAQKPSAISLAFLFSAFILLFSLRFLNNKNRVDLILLAVSSVLLIFTYNLSVFFVIFNLITVFILSVKKKKSFPMLILCVLGLIILILPALPFALKMFQIPDFLNNFVLSLNGAQVGAYFTNIFSPKLDMEGILNIKNFGAVVFVTIPSLICISLVLINLFYQKQKSNTYYILGVSLSTFFSMLILCVLSNAAFMSKYLITLFPLFAVCANAGVFNLKSKALRIIFITLYATMTIFYIVSINLSNVELF
jgi:4-amino-4-deoxy-L-arabinose transferase-like glycosyltransferase